MTDMAETPGRVLSPEELAPHLLQLREPVMHALRAYVSIGDGQFGIDHEAASVLQHKPGKGYSAWGEGEFTIGDEVVGKAHVLVLQEGDATGNPGPYDFVRNAIARDLPQEDKIFPRRKNLTSSEVFLPLAAKSTDRVDSPAKLYDVTVDLLGFLPRRPEVVRRIGELGVDQVRPNADELGLITPQAYYTVEPRLGEEEARRDYRQGDPHTILYSVAERA